MAKPKNRLGIFYLNKRNGLVWVKSYYSRDWAEMVLKSLKEKNPKVTFFIIRLISYV